ncbi:MAG TPA: methanogenesis marker protein Mmp4/MtxX [Methanospirillum sp.]|nr:methanogenesis marker protein Mmp4/MtxX [Methanospirillum sp.]
MISEAPGLIGIGIGTDAARVYDSIRRYKAPHRIRCYIDSDLPIDELSLLSPCPVIRDTNPSFRLINDLQNGVISAAVRGTLPSNLTLQTLKTVTGTAELERIVLLETASGIRFFLAPVGVDEGWTVEQKLSLINRGQKIAGRFGLSDQVGVLSGGRLGDVGRHPVVDRSMADAELICRISGARHFEILIEEAIKECGLIIAPDGISGNIIFRTLIFAGNGISHGAPVVNIDPIFIDTSRVNPDYTCALILADSMIP